MTGSIITPSSLYGEKQKMAAAIKKVARFDLWIDPVFDQRLRDEKTFHLAFARCRSSVQATLERNPLGREIAPLKSTQRKVSNETTIPSKKFSSGCRWFRNYRIHT